tara:strand:- start:418 stop:1428 length:1011 start_codon:yes stop_codon:yes gene_type:complete
MKLLVTGGLGYLGSHTVVELTNNGHEVVILDNLFNSSKKVLDKINKILGKQITFFEGDILDKALLKQIIKNHKIKGVFHFAGLKSVKESIKNKKKYYDVNVGGTKNLVESMQENIDGFKYVIFSSSACVYGAPNYLPYDENHSLSPKNYYGETKLFTENFLKTAFENNAGWKIICLRYFNPIGAHESHLIGDDPKYNSENIMPIITDVASSKKKKLKIFGFDYSTLDGTPVRDFIHVSDLMEGHLAAFNFLKKSKNQLFDVFNLGTGHGISVLELIKTFEKVNGIKIPYEFSQRRPGDLQEYYADIGKASEILNWTASRSLSDMCFSSWKFQELLK